MGTVGAAVVQMIGEQQSTLVARCGRPIEVVAVCARSRSKKRGIDIKKLRWVADPMTLATDPEIDVFVELMGGAGDPARAAVHGRAQGRQIGGDRQQGAAGAAWR